MKIFFLAFALMLLLTCVTNNQSTKEKLTHSPSIKTLTNEEVLLAIEKIWNDPVSESMDPIYTSVLDFIINSDDVIVTLSNENMPWLIQDQFEPDNRSGKLIVAYSAGIIKWQLENDTKEEPIQKGNAFLLHVYDAMREVDPDYYIEEIETLRPKNEQQIIVNRQLVSVT